MSLSRVPWGAHCAAGRDAAKQYCADLAFAQVVTVHVMETDRYSRTVGEVKLPGGRNLNQELVRAGFSAGRRRLRMKKERITGNTVMRVAIRLITERFELKPGEGPNDEEELFGCIEKALAKR